MGLGSPHEPYWRTNNSFSPPPPRWDFRFQNEGQGQSFGSQEGSRLYGSSISSNSRESRNWLRGDFLPNYQHSDSDRVEMYFSSPSDLSQWTPPIIQEISLDEYANSSKRVPDRLSFSPTSEELSALHSERASSSPRFQDLSIASCEFEFPNVSGPIESDSLMRSNVENCGLCERFLSRRSPWNSNGDTAVTGVLSCGHVFHAECLDRTTPNSHKSDPSCPICAKLFEAKNSLDQRVLLKSRNGFVASCDEDGPARPWGCARVHTNCVEGALSAPSSLLINRNRIKKSRPLKSNLVMEFSGKRKKSGTNPPDCDGDGVGCSKSASSSRKIS